MIRIKDYIFNENDIKVIENDEDLLTIIFKDGSHRETQGTFEDIEWNYGTQKRTQEHTIRKGVCDKNKKPLLTIEDIQLYIEELEEENERLKAEVDLLNDNRHFLNNKIDKAIEYMENTIVFDAPSKMTLNDTYIIDSENYNNLLKILENGEENENN